MNIIKSLWGSLFGRFRQAGCIGKGIMLILALFACSLPVSCLSSLTSQSQESESGLVEPNALESTEVNTLEPASTSISPTNVPEPESTSPPTSVPEPTDTSVPSTKAPEPTDTSIPPTNVPEPTDTPIPPTNTPEPTDTPIPPTNTLESPTPTPFNAQENCEGDKFNCVDFNPIGLAQGMFDACQNAGYGDPHRLDFDNDNKACEQPDLDAEQRHYNPPTPTSSAPAQCQSDTLNCSNFNSQWEAQQLFDQCRNADQGDIHRLDQDNNGVACENDPRFAPPPTQQLPPTQPPSQQNVCDCSYDAYNCGDFPLDGWITAQQCFSYCQSIGRGDVHNLDRDGDGAFCEG